MSTYRRVRCARDGCTEPPSYPSRRYCATHRQEHGQLLLAQLNEFDTHGRPHETPDALQAIDTEE